MTKLSLQAWMIAPETQKVMEALGDARFVGGCVRNTLVNRKVIDIDIATPLKPDAVIERLVAHQINYAPTGIKHGTVTAIVDGHPFEITTLRVDVNTDGRHAEVAFTDDWKEDAARRDFTVNAISATVEGELFDYFGGIEDLRLGRIRFVGDAAKRIDEDVLRILRYFRFYAHFGQGVPDADAIQACKAAASKITTLSAERIRQEILKLLESNRAAEVWQLMLDCGIVQHFLFEATQVSVLQNLIKLEAECHSLPFAVRRLAALLGTDVDTKFIAHALRLSGSEAEQLSGMMQPVSLQMSNADVRQLVYKTGNDMARNLLLLSAARSGDKGNFDHLYHLATSYRAVRFPLAGDDVMALGYKSGPDVGRVLQSMEDWWILQDFVPGRSECLLRLKDKFKPE